MAIYTAVVVISNVNKFATRPFDKTGFDVKELAYVWNMVQNNPDVKLEIVSPRGNPRIFNQIDDQGGECHMDPKCLRDHNDDEIVQLFLKDKQVMDQVKNSKKIGQVQLEGIRTVILIGGHGCIFDFPNSQELLSLIRTIWTKNNGMVAAISHGTCALVNARDEMERPLVYDKEVTCPSNAEELKFRDELPFMIENKLQEAGAIIQVKDPFSSNVVISETRMITGQNCESSKEFADAIKEQWKVIAK